MTQLLQNTAVTIMVGQLVDYADAKTLLVDNATFDPTQIAAVIYKNGVGAAITLAKTGAHAINLSGNNDGMATLTLPAADVDTVGSLQISFANATVDGISTDYILPFTMGFDVAAVLPTVSRQTAGSTTPTDYGTVADMDTMQLQAALYQLAQFGEDVIYKPFGGTARGILALVSRQGTNRIGGTKEALGLKIVLYVANSAADGVLASEFKRNQDKVNLIPERGEAARDMLMNRIISQDAGMLGIEVG